MNELVRVVAVYLLTGIIFLAAFDLCTKRVRERLKAAAYETQDRLAGVGSAVGTKTAIVVLFLAIWLFWPAIVYGAIESRLRSKKRE